MSAAVIDRRVIETYDVSDGRRDLGFVRALRCGQFEACDALGESWGLFNTRAAAVDVILTEVRPVDPFGPTAAG